MIEDGSCEHYWEFSGVDPEGIKEYSCRNCSHGKRLRDEFVVEDGKIL